MSGRDGRWLAAILALAVGLPLVLALSSGALGIPHNDDWDYRRTALGFYRDGHIQPAAAVMSLVGQVLAVQPLLWLSDGAPWAFGVMTAGLACVGLVAAYRLVRRVVDPGPAVVTMLTLVLFPGFTINTTSFMTDVPALAMAFVCLELGAAAVAARGPAAEPAPVRWRLLAASMIAGCFGISIREFDLAAPVAVLVMLAAADRRYVRTCLAAGAAVLIATAVIHLAAARLPVESTAPVDLKAGWIRLQQSITTLAFALVPATVLAFVVWRGRVWRRDLLPGVLVGLAIAWGPLVSVMTNGSLPRLFIGNLFAEFGTSGSGALTGSRPALYPLMVWHAVQSFGLVATVVVPGVVTGIVGAVIRSGGASRARVLAWLGSPTGLLAAFVAFTVAGLVVFCLAYSMFDRYLWPLIPAAGALLLARQAAEQPAAGPQPGAPPGAESSGRALVGAMAASAVLLTALGLLALAVLLNSNAFSVARWRMAGEAAAQGVPPETIDAGSEWVGTYATGPVLVNGEAKPGALWYSGWWPSFVACAVVSSSQLSRTGYTLLAGDVAAYRQFDLVGPPLPLYVYRVTNPACP